MRRWAILLLVSVLLSGLASPAWAAKYLSVDQVEQLLAQLHGKPDGKVAAELGDIQLTQRVSSARLAHWETEFPGSRAHEELLKLADMSAFLSPPASDVVVDPRPDTKAQLEMLSLAVQYVGKTIPRLPDFYAMRETTHFEGISPAGYLLGEGETALESTGVYNRTVTYRDGKEIPFETVGKREKEPAVGLTTNGEFGPILIGVLRDALASKIAFLRWERGPNGSTGVFGYTVAENGSHFTVDTTIGNWARTAHPAYHGEIEIDPASGEILRLSEIADTNPVEPASIEVEYAPVTIGGRSYICPVRGVAFSKLRVRPDGVAMDRSVWPIHAFLNDVAFTHYHEFVAEARIVTNPTEGSGGNSAGSGGAAAPENSASTAGPVSSEAAAGAPVASAAAPTGSPQAASDGAANETAKSPSNASAIPNGGAPVAPVTDTEATPESRAAEAAAPVAPASPPSSPPVVAAVLAPVSDAQPKLEADIKVSSHLVVVDVVVRKGDHTVSGLKQSDFAVYEDGVPQTIRNFSPHFADEQADAANATAQTPGQAPNLPPDTFSNLPVANVTDSVTVLLLDGLNTAPADVQYVRREMISYLKGSPPNRRIAVFVLAQSLRMLQGFTTDTSQLMAALAKADATSPASLLPPDEQRIDEAAELAAMSASGLDTTRTKMWMAEADASQTEMRADMTLDAMEQISRYLGGVPGRKNLVWFSGSFPLQFFAITQNPLGDTNISPAADFNERVKEAADMLAAARIAVYPVDARGVLLQPMFAANQATPATTTTRRDFTVSPTALANGGPQGGTFGSDVQLAPGQRSADHSSMDLIAQQTGGRAVYDSNGLQQAMADALNDGSNFYTLAYVPTNTNYNGAQRNIQLRLAHGKADLFYRRSYYADAATPTENGAANGSAQGSRGVFLASMERGVPASSEIVFDVRAAAADQGAPSGLVAGTISAMKNRAARYVIDYAANLATINLTKNANGVWQGHVDALAIAYDRDGKLLNWAGNKVPIALDQAAWDQSSRSGLQIHQVLDLPAGDVFLRVGLYDPGSGRFGSMEIPLHISASK
jgi:VWFA-related protein